MQKKKTHTQLVVYLKFEATTKKCSPLRKRTLALVNWNPPPQQQQKKAQNNNEVFFF